MGVESEVSGDAVRTKTVEFRLRPDGILYGIALPDRVQSPADAYENLDVARRLSNHERVPLLLDIRTTGTLSREAREIYASEEGARTISALAFVANSAFTRVVGNLFIRLAKTLYPVRLFDDEIEAATWLQRFRS